MNKRIMTLVLAASFVAPVVSNAKSDAEAQETTVSRYLLPAGVIATLATLSAYVADAKYNNGRGGKQVVKLVTRAKDSSASQAASARVVSAWTASVNYVAQTRGAVAAAKYARLAASRLQAIKFPAMPAMPAMPKVKLPAMPAMPKVKLPAMPTFNVKLPAYFARG